ncbi:hypothetical protein FA15DRAFT_77629 [Coprinopsis marcescibilis]|uniref:Uncharacterized protein n=1 Tax=Coprinopsis marcescibilis TaxID=230819 RepID=A0A5C3KM94_COPMA|nr:hypothetical protein FA15DRAFT_77629 [Coprinopsis marcescibilis]
MIKEVVSECAVPFSAAATRTPFTFGGNCWWTCACQKWGSGRPRTTTAVGMLLQHTRCALSMANWHDSSPAMVPSPCQRPLPNQQYVRSSSLPSQFRGAPLPIMSSW